MVSGKKYLEWYATLQPYPPRKKRFSYLIITFKIGGLVREVEACPINRARTFVELDHDQAHAEHGLLRAGFSRVYRF